MIRHALKVTTLGLATLALLACVDDAGSGSTFDQDGAASGLDIVGQDDGGLVPDASSSEDAGDTTDTAAPADTAAPGDTADTAEAADTARPADTVAGGPTLTIIVEGDLEDRSPDDGLSAQTPSVYRYGLQRLELLEADGDPTPHVIFDYAPDYVVVDMLGDNLVARVPIAELPAGSYPYFRIVLTHLEATVDASLHQVPVVQDLATPLNVVYALSDVTSGDLDLDQGDAVVSASIFGNPVSVPTHWDPVPPNPGPAAWAEAVDGEWRVTFAASPTLTSSPAVQNDVTYVIRFYVANSFRWTDLDEPGYADGVWDITVGTPPTVEPVARFGANAWEVYREGF